MVLDGAIAPSQAIAIVSSLVPQYTLLASDPDQPTTPDPPPPASDLQTSDAALTRTAMLDRLAASHVVYLGEYHDRVYDHQAQLEILRELHQRHPQLTIAMEMFQRLFQGAIDAYLAGEIDEAELIDRTEYETRWGYPWELYAPILRWARAANVPIVAANAPAELTRKVAAEGLTSLSGEDFRHIPPIAEIRLDDEDYRNALYQFFQMHRGLHSGAEEGAAEDTDRTTRTPADPAPPSAPSAATSTDDGFERFFAAQVLWDETMAEAIATAHHSDPDRLLVVLAGRGHIAYNFGIPSRVQRRILGNLDGSSPIQNRATTLVNNPTSLTPTFVQTSVFFAQQDSDRASLWPVPDTLHADFVDYFWSF